MDFNYVIGRYLSFVNKLIPKPAALSVIGIDIGTFSIKALELNMDKGNWLINQWGMEPILGQDVKLALQKITQRFKITDQQLAVSVVGKGTLIRYVEMPRMSLEELRKAYLYDLDKYFPFDPKSIYTDCAILDPESQDKKMLVLVVGVKKELVDERIKLFKDLGLTLNYVTLNAVAIANAVHDQKPWSLGSSQAKAVLDIGSSTSSLTIFKDWTPRFTRDIYVGSQEMTRKIAQALDLDVAHAEAMKCACPADKLSQVIEICEMPLTNLTAEIRVSLDYFMTEKNLQVDELFLCGGGSLLKGIAEVFAKHLGITVKVWDPVGQLKLKPGLEVNIKDFSAQFAVARGLGNRV